MTRHDSVYDGRQQGRHGWRWLYTRTLWDGLAGGAGNDGYLCRRWPSTMESTATAMMWFIVVGMGHMDSQVTPCCPLFTNGKPFLLFFSFPLHMMMCHYIIKCTHPFKYHRKSRLRRSPSWPYHFSLVFPSETTLAATFSLCPPACVSFSH